MTTTPLAERFQAFSPEHFLLLGIFLVGCVGFGALGGRLRASPHEPALRRCLALAIPVFTVPLQVEQLLPRDFGLGTSLPLQVCDLAWMVATYALLTRSPRAAAVLYYWATLVVQAIITPSLEQHFPQPRYFMFWGMHFLTVWAACYLTFGLRLRPTWRGYRLAVVVTLGWAVAVMTVNGLAGTNYGYLNGKPHVDSLLDVLGPWPAYVVLEFAVVAGGWTLLTWPWTHVRNGATTASVPAGRDRPAVR